MRSHAKAVSAACSATSGTLRRALVPLGLSLSLCALALVGAPEAHASKVVYDFFGNPSTSTPNGNAVDGGLFNTPRGVAVNVSGAGGAAAGDVYVVNGGANRIDQFSSKGQFIRAFGQDVVEAGKANDGGTGFEICDTTAGNAPHDCKAGIAPAAASATGGALSSPHGIAIDQATGNLHADCKAGIAPAAASATGGALSSPHGIAIDQATGNLHVSNQGFLRVEVFDATGHFLRAFGQDVVSAGPGNSPATAAKQTFTVSATEGQYKLSFRGQATADIAFNATAAQVDAALEALDTIGTGGVAVTGGPGGTNPYLITFAGGLNNAPMPPIGVAAGTTPLGGGSGASVANTTTGATGYEVCTAPDDICKGGVVGASAGAFANIFDGHLAVAPTTAPNAGNILVADPGNRHVDEYTSVGAFLRSFGWDTVANGPGDSGAVANEQQTVTVTADGGTFTLRLNPGNQTTGPIKFNATAAEVETALNSLSNVAAVGGKVSVSGGPGAPTTPTPYTISFGGHLGGDDIAQLSANSAALTLSTGTKSALVATTSPGGAFEICRAGDFDVCKVAAAAGSETGQFAGNSPNRIAVDSSGAVYTLEQVSPNFRVQKFTPSGSNLTPSVFNPQIGVAPGVFLSGTSGQDTPTDIAIGASGHVLVTKVCAAASNCPEATPASERRIYELDSAGDLLDTHIASAGINTANGLAANPSSGRLYMSSTTNGHRIYVVDEVPGNSPLVSTNAAAAGAGPHLRTLEGTVNPAGFKVSECRFEYGPSADYGESTPCVPGAAALGDGNLGIAVTASTAPLEPGTVYHYRLVASNVGADGQGKDRTFATAPAPAENCANADIRAAQGIGTLLLPDCMALEQVTPARKGNQHTRLPRGLSATGDRLLFNSMATLGDCPNINVLGGDFFLAGRDAESGWAPECVNPPFSAGSELGLQFVIGSAFGLAPDFGSWFQYALRDSDGNHQFFRMSVGVPFSPIPISAPFKNLVGISGPRMVGNSADFSKLYFTPENREGRYFADDPQPAGAGEDTNLYIAERDADGTPTTTLFARDRNGKVWGGNCASRLGGMESTTGGNLNVPNGERTQGAIAADGSRVYFSTRPDQPVSGACTEANKKRIMERLETPTGPEIKELIASECDRVSPACASHDGDDIYQGASVDQSKVYFTTNRQLTNTDLDGSGASCIGNTPIPDGFFVVPGCDLYLYDRNKPEGERLTQISAGDETSPTPGEGANVTSTVAAISADGSRAYFTAAGILTTDPSPSGEVAIEGKPNFYAWDAGSGEIAFIGGLATGPDSADNDGGFSSSGLWGTNGTWNNGTYPVPVKGTDEAGKEVGGDGHLLFFNSRAPLTDDDEDGKVGDLFRYDASTHQLERVSRAAPGGSDNGPFAASGLFNGGIGSDYGERSRPISEDGETVVFRSEEALLPGDVNGAEDVYMWRGGGLYRLPGSTQVPSVPQNTPVVSHDGSTVAYHSIEQLLSSDGDTATDVYVARVEGGYRTQGEAVCQGEACQGAPASVSGETGTLTDAFAGAGNLPSGRNARPGPKRCPKGKRKARRGGKSRCVAKRKGRRAGARRRANR